MHDLNRRTFLKSSALIVGAAATNVVPKIADEAPSDRIRVACIDVRNRGAWNAYEFNNIIDVVTVCDLGESRTSGDTDIPVMEPPADFDWNEYVDPAPYTDFLGDGNFLEKYFETGNFNNPPYNFRYGRSRRHIEFRWWYDYSSGKLTDWEFHHLDCALWALELDKKGVRSIRIDGSKAVHPIPFVNGYPTFNNRYNTRLGFDIGLPLSTELEIRVVSESENSVGILFEGSKGRFFVNCQRISGRIIEDGIADEFNENDYKEPYNGLPFEGHKKNLLRYIREGGMPVSDAWSHVQSMHARHLCVIAARLNRAIEWAPVEETIVGDDQAASFMARKQREGYEIPEV